MPQLALESFDVVEPPAPIETFDDGYAAGLAAGRAEAEVERTNLAARLVDSLTELTLTQKAAEQQVLASLAPLFDAIVTQLLPAMAREAIGAQIVEVLLDRAASVAGFSAVLRLSPDDHPAVSAAATAAGLAVSIVSDPTLTPGQVMLGDNTGLEDFIDLGEIVSAICVAFDALSSPMSGDHHDDR